MDLKAAADQIFVVSYFVLLAQKSLDNLRRKIMNRITINEEIAVTKMGFKKDLSAYPRRMEFRGTIYEFLDAGLRCLVRSGESLAEIITLTDGQSQYRLRSDNHGGNWMLLSIMS
jgi:hypothetical protein